jgi:hypothetical protein
MVRTATALVDELKALREQSLSLGAPQREALENLREAIDIMLK